MNEGNFLAEKNPSQWWKTHLGDGWSGKSLTDLKKFNFPSILPSYSRRTGARMKPGRLSFSLSSLEMTNWKMMKFDASGRSPSRFGRWVNGNKCWGNLSLRRNAGEEFDDIQSRLSGLRGWLNSISFEYFTLENEIQYWHSLGEFIILTRRD